MFHCFFILLKVFYVISNESGGDGMFLREARPLPLPATVAATARTTISTTTFIIVGCSVSERESAGFSSLSRSILSLALLSGRGKRDFPVSFCSFLSYGCDLAASGSISQLLLLLQRQRQNTNKRAVIFLLWILIIFSFGSDLI